MDDTEYGANLFTHPVYYIFILNYLRRNETLWNIKDTDEIEYGANLFTHAVYYIFILNYLERN